jgi:hypothetical protein
VLKKWVLATADGQSHIVCMPGAVTRERIDAFVADLAAATGATSPITGPPPEPVHAVAAPVADQPTAARNAATTNLRQRVARVLR